MAVKLGGACGGLRNFAEVMAEVVTGLNGLDDEVAGPKGRIWFKMVPRRAGTRKGARMTRQMMVKRAAEVSRMSRGFGRARLTDVRRSISTHGGNS